MDTPSDLKARIIVAGPCSPTQRLSELLQKILAPLVPMQQSYIKDDWDLLRKLPRNNTTNYDLFSCDVTSLYTSIPHD